MAEISRDVLMQLICMISETVDFADAQHQPLIAAMLNDALENARALLKGIDPRPS